MLLRVSLAFFIFLTLLSAMVMAQRSVGTEKTIKQHLDVTQKLYTEGKYIESIEVAQRGLTLPRIAPLSQLKFYTLLASMYSRLSMSDSAMYWYNQTENFIENNLVIAAKIPKWVEFYYYEKGFYYLRRGDDQQASNYLLQSLEMTKKIGSNDSYGTSLLQMGNYYITIKQYSFVISYYQQALQYFTKNSIYECWGLTLLGYGMNLQGHSQEGYKHIVNGIKLYRKLKIKSTSFEIEALYYKAQCELKLRILTQSFISFHSCIALYQKSYGNKGELLAYSWIGLAKIANARHEPTEALAYLQKALVSSAKGFKSEDIHQNPASDDIQVGKALFDALQLKGDLFWEKFATQKSLASLKWANESYRTALNVAQRIRQGFVPTESRYFFNEKVKPCVSKALQVAFEWQGLFPASFSSASVFEIFQQYQSIALTEVLHEKTIKTQALPRHLLVKEQTLKQRQIDTEKEIGNEPNSEKLRLLTTKLEDIKREQYQFEEQLSRSFPTYYALRYDVKAVSIPDFLKNLDEETALLSFFWGDRYLYGYLLAQDTYRFFRVPASSLAKKTTTLRAALAQNPEMFAYTGQAEARFLYGALIQPVASQLQNYERLIVIRDELLNYIPFEVLESAEKVRPYLGQHLAISYSYNPKLMAGLAPAIAPKAIGFAPFSTEAIHRGAHHSRLKLLRYSASEVMGVTKNTFLNAQATKEQFLRSAKDANLLYLATHAYSNDQQPAYSSILFYPTTFDSILTASELSNLPLERLKLVVLSGCEGNAGYLRKAEGLLSLARAFRLAGCPTILTTSWTAHEKTTADIARLFQKYLQAGNTADRALYYARLDYFASVQFGKYNHPYYWANFTLIGDPNTRFSTPDYPWYWGIVGSVGLLILGLGIYYWRFKTNVR